MSPEYLESFVASRRFGKATVTIICDGALRWAPQLQVPEDQWRAAMPAADSDGRMVFDVNVALIRLGDALLLVDTAFEDPDPTRPGLGGAIRRTPGVVAGLGRLGVTAEDITHVLITHAHGDHIYGSTVETGGKRGPRYPNARYFIGRADWLDNPARENLNSPAAIHLGTLDRLGYLDLVDGDQEIVPGVAMLHAPGESPGHSIVRVHSDGESFYFLGDLFHHPCEVEHVDWVSYGRDGEALILTRHDLIGAAAREAAVLVFSHVPFPGWGMIDRHAGTSRWRSI